MIWEFGSTMVTLYRCQLNGPVLAILPKSSKSLHQAIFLILCILCLSFDQVAVDHWVHSKILWKLMYKDIIQFRFFRMAKGHVRKMRMVMVSIMIAFGGSPTIYISRMHRNWRVRGWPCKIFMLTIGKIEGLAYSMVIMSGVNPKGNYSLIQKKESLTIPKKAV